MKSLTVLAFVVVFAGTTYGHNFICDVNATKSVTCSGVQEEPLYIQLVPTALGHLLGFKKITQKGETGIFRYRKRQILFYDESFNSSIKQRLDFAEMNGTIILNPATKEDSGTYRVEIINDNDGKNVGNLTIQIIIKYVADAPSTVTSSTYMLVTDNDNPEMETVYVMSLASALLGMVLLCGAVGVVYVCQRRTHTDSKPAETFELVYADVSVLKRQNHLAEESKEEMECKEGNSPAATVESATVQLEDPVYVAVRQGQ